MNKEDRALLVAMELLRVQVSNNSLALAANTVRVQALARAGENPSGPRPAQTGANPPSGPQAPTKPPEKPRSGTAAEKGSRTGADRREQIVDKLARAPQGAERKENPGFLKGVMSLAVGPIAGVLGVVGAKFAAVAAPLALLGAVVSSATSGFSTVMSSVKLFASTLAPIILPAALMLATQFVTFADVINDVGMPVMETFFGVIIDTAIPAIEWMTEKFESAAKGIVGFVDSLDFVSAGLKSGSNDLFGRGNSKTRERTGNAMRDVLQSFKQSIQPKASISAIGDVGRSIQMAALDADPLDIKLARQQLSVLERIEAAVAKREASDRLYDPSAGVGPPVVPPGGPR